MSPNRGPVRDRRPLKSPRRHARDCAFHLANAMRSLDEVRALAHDPITHEFINRLSATLLDARAVVEPLIDAATCERARVR
jgi:hypothetical protein